MLWVGACAKLGVILCTWLTMPHDCSILLYPTCPIAFTPHTLPYTTAPSPTIQCPHPVTPWSWPGAGCSTCYCPNCRYDHFNADFILKKVLQPYCHVPMAGIVVLPSPVLRCSRCCQVLPEGMEIPSSFETVPLCPPRAAPSCLPSSPHLHVLALIALCCPLTFPYAIPVLALAFPCAALRISLCCP